MSGELYQLTPGDRKIFQKAYQTGNPNWFTNYYLRSADSGTWWRPVTNDVIDELFVPEFKVAALKWKTGYEQLLSAWSDLGKPGFFVEASPGTYEVITAEQHDDIHGNRKYRVVEDINYSSPVFHHNHGFLFLPWQLEAMRRKEEERVIIGGFGSGKTISQVARMLFHAATLKSYRGFALAPFSVQANEVYAIAMNQLLQDSVYSERFLLRAPTKPMKHMVIGHSGIGANNTIECYPILDDPDKIRTVTGDEALIDQAEKLPNLNDLRRDIGTRFRGQTHGRERIGTITYLANSGDSPELWDLYDEGETNKNIWAVSPNSADNSYLTIRDMLRFQRVVGSTADERRMYLAGGRPLGSGDIFPASSLVRCKATWMDEMMEEKLAEQDRHEKNLRRGKIVTDRWIHLKAPKIGTHRWEMPPEEDESYLVIADAGWKNPPFRDSAVVMVWKITGFPLNPAHLVAFHWVAGNGSPLPWMNQYRDYVTRYKAIGQNGYDATGSGSSYGKMTDINELLPDPIQLAGTKKQGYITLTQKILAKGLLQMPSIEHIFSQLARYEYPEPKDMRQDLVMGIVLTCAWLERLWYQQFDNSDEDQEHVVEGSRYARSRGRERWHRR